MFSRLAASEQSRKRIAGRLLETREWLHVSERYARTWLETYYQAANRYAHLRWFVEVLDARAWLANIYFVEDPDRPTNRAAWATAIHRADSELGLAQVDVPGAGRVFLSAGLRGELLAAAGDC
jgi:hypothetical protein